MRKHNFSAGPGALPLSVLEEAAANLVDHHGSGLSLMEMSHRTPGFESILFEARETIARLYGLPDSHEVLFLQGGASLQFAMVPYNLGQGAYINTGVWSQKAIEEARRIGPATEVWSAKAGGFRDCPSPETTFDVAEGTKYLHLTTNNTIYGTQWRHVPEASVPLVADLSSDFLSEPVALDKFDLVYAGAQKNAGPSGVTVVIGKRDVLRSFTGAESVPTILRYKTQAENDSMYNTPNTFGIYLVGLVAKWVRDNGGLVGARERAVAKSAALYRVIDNHPEVYRGHAAPASRSRMNVTWNLVDDSRQKVLLAEADRRGIIGLKGHRLVGGLRASIYNAVPETSVQALIDLLNDFAAGKV